MTGRRWERKLVVVFEDGGFAVIKSPSSGSGTDRDQPDMVVSSSMVEGLPPLAVEAKTTAKDAFTITEEEAQQLVRFANRFGAVPVVAMYWKRPNSGGKTYGGWYFRRLSEVRRSPAENEDGGHHLRPRREDRHEWASIEDLQAGRLTTAATRNNGGDE